MPCSTWAGRRHGELISVDRAKAVLGALVAGAAMVFSVAGRSWWERRAARTDQKPAGTLPEDA